MAVQKRQVITTGSGSTKTPILASGNAPTGEQLKPSQTSTSIESGSTKPLSVAEALSVLQTLCFDLRSMECEVSILARKNRLYLILATPTSSDILQVDDGQIVMNNKPVILAEKVI